MLITWWRKRTVSALRKIEFRSSWQHGGFFELAAICCGGDDDHVDGGDDDGGVDDDYVETIIGDVDEVVRFWMLRRIQGHCGCHCCWNMELSLWAFCCIIDC